MRSSIRLTPRDVKENFPKFFGRRVGAFPEVRKFIRLTATGPPRANARGCRTLPQSVHQCVSPGGFFRLTPQPFGLPHPDASL